MALDVDIVKHLYSGIIYAINSLVLNPYNSVTLVYTECMTI